MADFKVIILGAALVFIALMAGVIYFMFSLSSIEIMDDNLQTVADGTSSLEINAYVRNSLGMPLKGVLVDFGASPGMVEPDSCYTGADGTCHVSFVPLKSLEEKTAVISVSASGLEETSTIVMIPDLAARLELEAASENLMADGKSSTRISARGINSVGNAVPDGTRIVFQVEPPSMGSLSKGGMCNTNNGACSVSFTSDTTEGNATIIATSSDVEESITISISPLDPKSMEMSLSSTSLPSDGKSTSVASVQLKDKLGNPVQGKTIIFSADEGTIDGECMSDSSGSCSVVYVAADEPGQDSITARVASLESSRTIMLLPVSDLTVGMMGYNNVGNPIIPAFVRSVDFHGHEMARIFIENTGNTAFKGSLSLEIPGWSDKLTNQIEVGAGKNADFQMTLPLNEKAYENRDSQQVSYVVTITDSEGEQVFANTYYTTLASANTMVFADPWTDLIAAWDTPNAPAIHALVSDAADYTPWDSMVGYQEVGNYTHREITYFHLKAMYDELDYRGMKYVNAPFSLEGTQTVHTPTESLSVNGGNCIDGSMVFASALTSMGMQPLLVLEDGHAFICARNWHDSEYIQCVETTMIGHADFEEAFEAAAERFEEIEGESYFRAVDLNLAIENGVSPLPS
jgi:hypothetical protein